MEEDSQIYHRIAWIDNELQQKGGLRGDGV